jgi:hypothetical protein
MEATRSFETSAEFHRTACHLLSSWFFARLIFRAWRWRRYVPPKRRLTFTGLHGVISQKTELFITAAARTSNPTSKARYNNRIPTREITTLRINRDAPSWKYVTWNCKNNRCKERSYLSYWWVSLELTSQICLHRHLLVRLLYWRLNAGFLHMADVVILSHGITCKSAMTQTNDVITSLETFTARTQNGNIGIRIVWSYSPDVYGRQHCTQACMSMRWFPEAGSDVRVL